MSSIPLMHTSVGCLPQQIQSPPYVGVTVARISILHASDPNCYIPEELRSPVQFSGEVPIHFARRGFDVGPRYLCSAPMVIGYLRPGF